MRNTIRLGLGLVALACGPWTSATEARVASPVQESTQSTQGPNILYDDVGAVIAYLRNVNAGSVESGSSLTGVVLKSAAADALGTAYDMQAQISALRGDVLLVSMALAVQGAAGLLGATDGGVAARAAFVAAAVPHAGPVADDAQRQAVVVLLRRTANRAIADAVGARQALDALGGRDVRRVLRVVAGAQYLGKETRVDDPWLSQRLRQVGEARLLAELAAQSQGLPPALAQGKAQDILEQAAGLQALLDTDLSDPVLHDAVRKKGLRGGILEYVHGRLGLPAGTRVSSDPGDALRRGAAIEGLGGNKSDPLSYPVLRGLESGRLSVSDAIAELGRLKTQSEARGGGGGLAQGGAVDPAKRSGSRPGFPSPSGKQGGTGTGPSSSGSPSTGQSSSNSRPAVGGPRPSGELGSAASARERTTGSGGSSSGSATGGSGATSGAGSTAGSGASSGSSAGSSSGSSSSGSAPGSSSPAAGPAPGGESSGASDTGQESLSESHSVRIRTEQTGPTTFTATEIWTGSDGEDYEFEAIEFSDADGDGKYMAATDSRWGAYHGKMPPNGEHEGVREDGETEWVVKAPAESQDGAGSGAEYKPNGERRGRGGPMHAFGHAHTLLLMSSRGNAYYVLMFGIGNGTGNTTPVPDGAIGVAWTGGHGQVPSSPVLGGCPTFEQLLGRSANAPVGGSNPRQDGVINPDRNGDGAGTGVKGSGGVSGLLKPQPAPPPPSVKVGDKAAPAPKGNAPSGKDRKDSRR